MQTTRLALAPGLLAVLAVLAAPAMAQTANGEWRSYGATSPIRGTRRSI